MTPTSSTEPTAANRGPLGELIARAVLSSLYRFVRPAVAGSAPTRAAATASRRAHRRGARRGAPAVCPNSTQSLPAVANITHPLLCEQTPK